MDSPGGVPSQGEVEGEVRSKLSPQAGPKSPLGCPPSVVRRTSPRTVQVT